MMSSDKKLLRYDDTDLDEESLRRVKQELNETEENKRRGLDILKKRLLDTEDLNPCLQDDFLLAFLRVSKYDCNKAYQRLMRYYEERWSLLDIYKDFLPSTVKIVETGRQLFACPYRKKDDSSAILILKRLDYDPSVLHYDLIIRALSLLADLVLQSHLNQMCGFTVILDLKSSSWSAWSEYTPSRLKLLAHLIQKSVPLRMRSIHVINAPPIYYLLYSIVYPFLSTKMRSRIRVHKNCSSLHSYIDPELLPEEYEGYLDHSELINLFERLYVKEDYFFKFSKYGFTKKKK